MVELGSSTIERNTKLGQIFNPCVGVQLLRSVIHISIEMQTSHE